MPSIYIHPDIVRDIPITRQTTMNIKHLEIPVSPTLPQSKVHANNGMPERYKTQLCRHWLEERQCPYYEECQFAHGEEELFTQ